MHITFVSESFFPAVCRLEILRPRVFLSVAAKAFGECGKTPVIMLVMQHQSVGVGETENLIMY
jgi:hypothetical protein